MNSALVTGAGYRATKMPDGVLVVHRVPIFVECTRGKTDFDEKWIFAAVAKAKLGEAENYLPPLHIRHHEAETDVRAAGFFRVLGAERITFKGKLRLAIMADLHITDPLTQAEVMAKRLPYRSVEIFNVEQPAINGLALLDHEAPFLELPMLMVGQVAENESQVPGGTLDVGGGSTIAASFKRGNAMHLLFRETTNMADETEDKPKGEKMEGDSAAIDVSAICKAIKSGSISVADMDAIMAAIKEQEGSKAEEPKTEATAPAPGAAMKQGANGDLAIQMARLQGELEAEKAKSAEFRAAATRKEDVAAALERLRDRPLGADLESKLVAFHKEWGQKAFFAYVEAYGTSAAPLPKSDADRAAANLKQAKVSPALMKYRDEGPERLAMAEQFSAQWRALKARGSTLVSEERFIQINMADNPFAQQED